MRAVESPDVLGPVDHLIVEFPAGEVTAQGFAGLVDLVDRGLIYVLIRYTRGVGSGLPRPLGSGHQ